MGTAVRPASTTPASWDAFSDVDAFVDEVLSELKTMAADGSRPTDTLEAEWKPHVACVVRVSRLTYLKDTRSGLWPTREEVGLYACQIRLDALTAAHSVRSHWGIENRAHYVRDVTMGEDASRIRQQPGIIARFRSVALNILRANGVKNVRQRCWCTEAEGERVCRRRAVL